MWTNCNYCIVNYFIKWGSQISLYVLCKVGMNECYIISSLIEWCQHFFIHDWHYSCQSDNNVKLGYTMEAAAFIFACFHYYVWNRLCTCPVPPLFTKCPMQKLLFDMNYTFYLLSVHSTTVFPFQKSAHASFANIVPWVMHFW